MLLGNVLGVPFRGRPGRLVRQAVMAGSSLTGGSILNSDGSVSVPGGAGWKGVHGGSMARRNGLAMLVRWQPVDVQAGTAGLSNARYAAGFFPGAAPADPLAAGHALTVANNDAQAGQLGVLGSAHGQALRSVKQLEHDLVVIASERGAVYYGAALAGARGYGDRPNMRPLAVDRSRTDATLVPGAYSRETGVRVEEFQTAVLEEYPAWYGTAHAADRLTGSGALAGVSAEVGGTWAGNYTKTATGAQRTGASGATIDPGVVTGLLAAEFTFTTATSGHELQFARVDGSNYSYIRINASDIAFVQVVAGVGNVLQTAPIPNVANRTVRVQVLFEGQVARLLIDGVVPSGIAPVTLPTAFAATRVGFYLSDLNGTTRCTRFEAHPVSVPIPAALRVAQPFTPKAATATLSDTFDGSGALASPWVRSRGAATLSRSGGSASAGGTVTGEDTHYVRPFASDYADLLLSYTSPPATANPDTTSCRATLVVEGAGPLLASETVALRAFIDPSQPGNSELEVMGYTAANTYVITNRVALALEVLKGAAQTLRFVVSGGRYVGYHGAEPVITGRTGVAIERAGVGLGFSDSGSSLQNFSAGT